jgi:hypothetical protein
MDGKAGRGNQVKITAMRLMLVLTSESGKRWPHLQGLVRILSSIEASRNLVLQNSGAFPILSNLCSCGREFRVHGNKPIFAYGNTAKVY